MNTMKIRSIALEAVGMVAGLAGMICFVILGGALMGSL